MRKREKQIIIEKYNPQWSVFFENESRKIKSVMGENAVEIYHVGSTSVPSLAAKPIIDMILVTRDLNLTRELLTSKELGYRYKGEYNLPLRDLYGKKGNFEIYLHVHHVNNPEIELNLLFRDYLRNNESDSVHLQGLHRTEKLEINTPNLSSEGMVSIYDVRSKVILC